eukprot:g14164.t1
MAASTRHTNAPRPGSRRLSTPRRGVIFPVDQVRRWLSEVFPEQIEGKISSLEDSASVRLMAATSGRHSGVYGELPFDTADRLFGHANSGISQNFATSSSHLSASASTRSSASGATFTKSLLYPEGLFADDVFYDLGSGTGKIVLQVFLTTRARKAVGVELGRRRFEASMAAKAEIQRKIARLMSGSKHLDVFDPGTEFRHANILEADLSDATVVFFSSLMFDVCFVERVALKLARESLKLRYLVLLTELNLGVGLMKMDVSGGSEPSALLRNSGLELVGSYQLEMGWSDKNAKHPQLAKQPVYVYAVAAGARAMDLDEGPRSPAAPAGGTAIQSKVE